MRKLVILLLASAVALVPAAFMAQAHAGSKYAVTLKTSAKVLNQGSKVVLSGKVSPKAAGKTVRLQMAISVEGDDSWSTKSTATIKSDGTFARTVTPVEGIRKWRAYKPSGSGHAGGKSPEITITTYRWIKMANADDTEFFIASGADYLGRYGDITVAGHTVTRYFATNQQAGDTTRWYTQHHCKRIRVEVGLYDESDPGSVGQFRIFADTDRIASVKVPYGTSRTVDASFSRSATGSIKFTGEARQPIVGPTAIVASNPRMLCTGVDPDDQP